MIKPVTAERALRKNASLALACSSSSDCFSPVVTDSSQNAGSSTDTCSLGSWRHTWSPLQRPLTPRLFTPLQRSPHASARALKDRIRVRPSAPYTSAHTPSMLSMASLTPTRATIGKAVRPSAPPPSHAPPSSCTFTGLPSVSVMEMADEVCPPTRMWTSATTTNERREESPPEPTSFAGCCRPL